MNKILIITPHFPPSNLAAVHRSRLFAQHLPSFGWHPIILCVDEAFYEEKLDWNLFDLVPKYQRIEKVSAFKIAKPRLIGDIGLRAFFQLRAKALKLIRDEKINFVFIPIPSFYVSLIGRWLYKKTGTPYGIDYIDPWVHRFPGAEKILSRHWFSMLLAKALEPIAIKDASLITGVAHSYFDQVIARNPHLIKKCLFESMPYGGEILDHCAISNVLFDKYLFKKNNKIQFVYAGAMLPKAFEPLEYILRSIANNLTDFEEVEFHFIGTGKSPNDVNGFNIKPLAEKYGLWNSIIFEYPERIPYLDVLFHLKRADAVFILGSTEPHYTPSKTYQAVLSGKPILAVLNNASSAVEIILKSNAGMALTFEGELDMQSKLSDFLSFYNNFRDFIVDFSQELVDHTSFIPYSAKSVTEKLAKMLDQVISKNELSVIKLQ